jgi:hypothetical protein
MEKFTRERRTLQAITVPELSQVAAVNELASLARERYELVVSRPGDPLYDAAFGLSVREYRRHFDCDLQSCYPQYFCLLRGGRLLGACGLRSASGALFLEQYLDTPVEKLLSQHFSGDFSRASIAELGGFAVKRGALALPLMSMVAPALQALGYTHAVATATLPVRRCVSRLGVPFVRLAAAARDRLTEDGTEWGSYYAMRPAVIGGCIDDALLHFADR